MRSSSPSGPPVPPRRRGTSWAVVAAAAVLGGCAAGTGQARQTATTTATPTPTPTATATAAPTPTPSPTPTSAPAALTGEAVPAAVATRPAVVVKVENTDQARPQSGLAQADVVVEELVEGGLTRFLAVFHTRVPDAVGPIRSGRLVDAELAPMFRGLFVYSGARREVEAALTASGMPLAGEGPLTFREPSRSAPHDLYARGPTLFRAAAERPGTSAPPRMWRHEHRVPAGGAPAPTVDVAMSRFSTTGWRWDAGASVYRRLQDGEAHEVVDGRIGAANVVLVASDVGFAGCCDTAGSPYVETDPVGAGEAVVLRDGRRFEARWRRAGPTAPLLLARAEGGAFPLRPGPTWILLVPEERMPR